MGGVFYPRATAAMTVLFDDFQKDASFDGHVFIPNIVPKTATVHLTGYKEPDTFQLTFDSTRVPFHPDAVRVAGAEVMFWSAEDMDEKAPFAPGSAPAIVGLCDNFRLDGDASGLIVSCDGKDYTQLLIEKPWPEGRRIPHGQSLKDTVQTIANEAAIRDFIDPRTGARRKLQVGQPLDVIFEPEEQTKVSAIQKGVTEKKITIKPPTVGHGRSRSHTRGGPVKSGRNYWDVIYGLCLTYGYVCFVRGTSIVITNPQTMQASAQDRIRRMVWGHNIKDLSVERHIGKITTPTIVISSYDPGTRTSIRAQFPRNPLKKITGANTDKEEVLYLDIHGVSDPAVLANYAENYYHTVSRGESTMKFSTRDLVDIDGKDLLQLRPGDPVGVMFDRFDESVLLQEKDIDRRQRAIEELGYLPDVAHVIALNLERMKQFRQPHYCKSVTIEWDKDQGLSIQVEAINYVSEKRDNIQEPIQIDDQEVRHAAP